MHQHDKFDSTTSFIEWRFSHADTANTTDAFSRCSRSGQDHSTCFWVNTSSIPYTESIIYDKAFYAFT